MRQAYLGAITLQLLHDLPEAQAGWLIRALTAWILEDRLPEEIPTENLGAWIAIREESKAIHDLRDARADAGIKSGENRRRTKPNKTEQNGTSANKDEQTRTSCARAETETETETKTETYTEEKPSKENSASDSDSVETSSKFFLLPESRLVPEALRLIGEEDNDRMRGRLGKAKRLLGTHELRELLATFAAELAAGEIPANPGATLNARLSAREAIG